METLLSSFFNISPSDSFVCLFIKIDCIQRDLGRRQSEWGRRVRACACACFQDKRGQKRGDRSAEKRGKKGRTGRSCTKAGAGGSQQKENKNIHP